MYARPQGQDTWVYSQAQQPVNPYATHTPAAGAGYGQDAASTPQQNIAFRNPPDSGIPGYMPRQPMSEYSTPPQQVAYEHQRGYPQHESPAGHYGDASNRLAQPMALNRHGHPAEGMPYSDMSYADQQPMMAAGSRNPSYPYHSMDQRPRYGAAGTPGPNTLPPLGSTSAATSQAALASHPAYSMTPNDNRYGSQPQGQGNGREYGGSQSGKATDEEN